MRKGTKDTPLIAMNIVRNSTKASKATSFLFPSCARLYLVESVPISALDGVSRKHTSFCEEVDQQRARPIVSYVPSLTMTDRRFLSRRYSPSRRYSCILTKNRAMSTSVAMLPITLARTRLVSTITLELPRHHIEDCSGRTYLFQAGRWLR